MKNCNIYQNYICLKIIKVNKNERIVISLILQSLLIYKPLLKSIIIFIIN